MTMGTSLIMQLSDWLQLFTHYLSLSLLAIGGAIATAPDMHRYLVDQQHWLTDAQFNASIAIAQAAPGPNVLFVALMGWNVGLNTGSLWNGLGGMLIAMAGTLLPSTTLTYLATGWVARHKERLGVRAFKQGMAPVVVGLVVATGWILASAHGGPLAAWPLWLITGATVLIMLCTRKVHLLWLLGAGAAAGWFGLV